MTFEVSSILYKQNWSFWETYLDPITYEKAQFILKVDDTSRALWLIAKTCSNLVEFPSAIVNSSLRNGSKSIPKSGVWYSNVEQQDLTLTKFWNQVLNNATHYGSVVLIFLDHHHHYNFANFFCGFPQQFWNALYLLWLWGCLFCKNQDMKPFMGLVANTITKGGTYTKWN